MLPLCVRRGEHHHGVSRAQGKAPIFFPQTVSARCLWNSPARVPLRWRGRRGPTSPAAVGRGPSPHHAPAALLFTAARLSPTTYMVTPVRRGRVREGVAKGSTVQVRDAVVTFQASLWRTCEP